MAKILRMSGTDIVWELDESVDIAKRAVELATARAASQFVTFRARLPGQSELVYLSLNPGQLAWWSLGEESAPPVVDSVP